MDRKSVSGYCFYHYGCLVSWSSQKQKVIASSSTEAEYYSPSYALREALWIRLFITSLQLSLPTPFPLLCDNQSAIRLANSDVSSPCSKHIDVQYHFIREKIEDGTFETSWIPTADMTADIFTKSLPFPAFSRHCSALGILPLPWKQFFLSLFLFFCLSSVRTRWGCIGPYGLSCPDLVTHSLLFFDLRLLDFLRHMWFSIPYIPTTPLSFSLSCHFLPDTKVHYSPSYFLTILTIHVVAHLMAR